MSGNETHWPEYIRLLVHEVVPAIGCTEPISVALACAHAATHLEGELNAIEVWVSGNIMKNGMGVGIPGTEMNGLPVAAAAGAIGGDAEAKLEVLKSLTPQSISKAKKFLKEHSVTIKVRNVPYILYVEAHLFDDKQNEVTVYIREHHTNIYKIEKNAKVVFEAKTSGDAEYVDRDDLHRVAYAMTIKDIWDFGLHAPLKDIAFIYQAAELNAAVSEAGLDGEWGLQIGKTIQNNIAKGMLSNDLLNEIVKRSSAASDARMGGCELPVMTNSGSGNQGIAATMPVTVVGEKIQASHEAVVRALAISHLCAIHIHSNLPTLSSLCAVTVAAMGSACGMVFLLGGTRKQAEFAIVNMIGNVTGMICDGAKNSCALKVSTSVSAAFEAVLMALDDIRVSDNEGIIDRDVEEVIHNLGLIATKGMHDTDKTILDIMTHKRH